MLHKKKQTDSDDIKGKQMYISNAKKCSWIDAPRGSSVTFPRNDGAEQALRLLRGALKNSTIPPSHLRSHYPDSSTFLGGGSPPTVVTSSSGKSRRFDSENTRTILHTAGWYWSRLTTRSYFGQRATDGNLGDSTSCPVDHYHSHVSASSTGYLVKPGGQGVVGGMLKM